MSIKLDHSDIQKLAKKAGVNKPVMSVRVVGNRIELHLLGGEVVPLSATDVPQAETGQDPAQVQHFSPLDVLSNMTVARLKRVAAYLEMSGYSKMNKRQLITAIAEGFGNDDIQEAVVNSAFS